MFEKLRDTREANKVTCEQLSHILGLKTRGAYHKKENGSVPFTLLEAKRIADFFKMNVDDIFFDNEVSEMDIRTAITATKESGKC